MQDHISEKTTRAYVFYVGKRWQQLIFIACLLICCTPLIGSGTALLLGLAVAQLSGHPFIQYNHRVTHLLLQFSVVGLGFGMNVHNALAAGKDGILFTVISISGTLLAGYFLGKWFKTPRKTSYLINSGTAICGGSAIAAISPVIQADEKQISVALGCVFLLNAFALLIFPPIGHYFGLSQTQFGTWCAIAIHDTSSVVGAAGRYGDQALEVATTIKLARALWIIPLAFFSGFLFKGTSKKVKIPYFILLFVVAMLLNTYFPVISTVNQSIVQVSKTGLTLTLFLIGAGLSRSVVRSVGIKPLLHGVLLWILIGGGALTAILFWL